MSHWAGICTPVCNHSSVPQMASRVGVRVPFSQRKKLGHGEKSHILIKSVLSRVPRSPVPLTPKRLPTSPRWPLEKTYHPQHKRLWWPVYIWDSQHHVARLSHKWLGHPLWDSVNKPRSMTKGQDCLLFSSGLELLLRHRGFSLWVSCPG